MDRKTVMRRERLAAALSGSAAACLIAGGAWYFVAAVWWLLRHDWPDWTWARLGFRPVPGGDPSFVGAAMEFVAGLSPGATALGLAVTLASVSRLVDPSRRRR